MQLFYRTKISINPDIFINNEKIIPRCQRNRPVYVGTRRIKKKEHIKLSGQYRRRIILSNAGLFEKTRFVLLYYIIKNIPCIDEISVF